MPFRKDLLLSFIVGLLVAVLLLGVARNAGIFPALLWLVIPVFPALSVLGMALALLLGKRVPVLAQFSKFLLVGALNTFVDLGVLNLFLFFTSLFSGPWFSVFKGVSFVVAVINSYFWNKFWTFKSARAQDPAGAGKEFLQFMAVSVVGFFVNVGTATAVVTVIGPQFGATPALWANLAAVGAVALSMLWNFTGYKLFVFKK